MMMGNFTQSKVRWMFVQTVIKIDIGSMRDTLFNLRGLNSWYNAVYCRS